MHPISPSNATLPPRLDNTSIILLGGERNTLHSSSQESGSSLMDTTLPSPCIELSGYDMPAHMIVPMVNREEEIHQVVQHNRQYFVQVQQQVDEPTFKKFQSTLYASRHQLNDQVWLKRIERFLIKISPPLWEKFQVLVDHFPATSTSTSTIVTATATASATEVTIPRSSLDSSTAAAAVSTPSFLSVRPPLLSQLCEQKYHGPGSSSYSTATSGTSTSSFRYLYEEHGYFFDPRIRQKTTFEGDITPFLQECRMAMDEDEYHLFVHWLFVSSSKISNEYWESALYECLNHHPILFLKLKDWIDNELE